MLCFIIILFEIFLDISPPLTASSLEMRCLLSRYLENFQTFISNLFILLGEYNMYFSSPLKFIETCFRCQEMVLLGEWSMWTRKKKLHSMFVLCLCDNYVQLVDGVVKIFYSFIRFHLLALSVSERYVFEFPGIIVILSVFPFRHTQYRSSGNFVKTGLITHKSCVHRATQRS